jgi:hypothetical protein
MALISSNCVLASHHIESGGIFDSLCAPNLEFRWQMVGILNTQTLQANPDTPASDPLTINPNLLLCIGYNKNHEKQARVTCMEITQPNGSTTQESLSQENLRLKEYSGFTNKERRYIR